MKNKGWNVNKRYLMLSTAAVALLAAPLFAKNTATATVDKADLCLSSASIHCVYSSVTDPLATSTASGVNNAAGPSNIYIFNDSDNGNGKIKIKQSDAAIITLDSNNYVYSNGSLTDADHSGAVGIHVDASKNPNATGIRFNNGTAQDYEFEDYELNLITGAAVYLDASSTLYVNGSGSGKTGILIDANGAASKTGTLTGDIITYYGSVISVNGDNSYGLKLDNGVTMNGNIQLSGSMSVYQSTAKSMDYSGLFGLYSAGRVNGNIGIYDSGTLLVAGSGARGMFITGDGVGGNVSITGTLETEGIDASSVQSNYSYYYSSSKKRTYPDAGPALTINSSIDKGVAITGLNYDDDSSSGTGTVVSYGIDSAVLISPSVTVGSTTHTMNGPLVLGLYQSYDRDTKVYAYEAYDPGFSFYNRGSISLTPTNVNSNAGAAVHVAGTSALATYLNGGFFSSGTIASTASTDDKDKSVTATSVYFDGNVHVGGYYASGAYTADSITYGTCSFGLCEYTYTSGLPTSIGGTAIVARRDDHKDDAAFVISGDTGSGSVSASVSGNGGGIATALLISKDSHVSSLRNSGTISAAVTTTNTDINSPLEAYAIRDLSGSLTMIYNAGTISASATTLDSDDQIADAINLTGNAATSDAAKGVTIINRASATKAAAITGDIRFGMGDNQRIYVAGSSTSYMGSIAGDIYYGACASAGANCGDVLSIGAFGVVSGNVSGAYSTDANGNLTYLNRISVEVANNGLLNLLNDKNVALAASSVTVQDGGYLSIGLKQDSGLNASGYIQASDTISIERGANLGVAYNSYVGGADGSPASYVLMKTSGSMNIADLPTYAHNISTPMSSTCSFGASVNNCGSMPFLFKSASLSQTNENELVLTVQPKSADDLKLTGYAKQMFSSINQAVATDDKLGAAMVNGIHADVGDLNGSGSSIQAQRAYDSFAPNISGGTRAIAVSITDQATGVVAARQRSLRMYAKEEGEMTLWTQEFVQAIKNPGQGITQGDESREKTGFRDHGFGVVVGMDAGNPTDGWYGGALTFYNGDVNEINRDSHENQLWFIGTGYGTWRGRGLFVDGKVDLGYAHIKGLRTITLNVGTGSSETTFIRQAQSAHSAATISGGVTSGATFTYGAFTLMPQFSVDALYLRENAYTEFNPNESTPDADGFSLTVKSHDAKSLRTFFGSSFRYDLDLQGVFLQPELRAGYRYDFLSDPVRLRAAFKDINPTTSGNQTGGFFSLTGPDPAKGNFVLGTSVGATTGAWSLNLGYDYIRGAHGNLEQAATLNLIGRI